MEVDIDRFMRLAWTAAGRLRLTPQFQRAELVNDAYLNGYWRKYWGGTDKNIMLILRYDMIRYLQKQGRTNKKFHPKYIPGFKLEYYVESTFSELIEPLNDEQKHLMHLRFKEKLNMNQLSERLGCSRVATLSRLKKAFTKLSPTIRAN